jgi:hypothetical protein
MEVSVHPRADSLAACVLGPALPRSRYQEQFRWGWLFYRRVKTSKAFYRPMNRVVHAHSKSFMPENPNPDAPIFRGGSARPNA